MDVAEVVFPENKSAFKNITLSRRTTVCHLEEMNSGLLTQLHVTVQTFAVQYNLSEQNYFCSQRIHVSCSAPNNCRNILHKLHEEFCRQFKDFKKVEHEIQLLTFPLSCNVEKAQGTLQLELVDCIMITD
jgi:hypothetical protein